jgi:hypothetical protein
MVMTQVTAVLDEHDVVINTVAFTYKFSPVSGFDDEIMCTRLQLRRRLTEQILRNPATVPTGIDTVHIIIEAIVRDKEYLH